MKITISTQRFNEIIKEEVEKFRKIQQLENDKKTLEEGLKKLQEAHSQEEIDELWGGLSKLFKTGAQHTADAASSAYNTVKQDLSNTYQTAQQKAQQIGQNVHQKAQQVGQAVQQKANAVKQIYQQGEKEQNIKSTKAQIEKLWKQRQIIQKQLNDMQAQYANLTGQKHNTHFQSKAPAAPVAPKVPTTGVPPQQNAA